MAKRTRSLYELPDKEHEKVRAKFLASVGEYVPGQCWLWSAAQTSLGYGNIHVGDFWMMAHRLSYELHKGPAGDLLVMHACDNPRCVNPEHLLLGTHAENSRDMRRKGRSQKGKASRRLSAAEARAVRAAAAAGRTQASIAAEFGITTLTCSDIINRRTWKHL